MPRLRIIPLDDAVVFPGMPVTLTADTGRDEQVFLVPRQHGTYAAVGVVADVSEKVKIRGRAAAVAMNPLHRGVAGRAEADRDGVLRVEVEARPDAAPAASLTVELE